MSRAAASDAARAGDGPLAHAVRSLVPLLATIVSGALYGLAFPPRRWHVVAWVALVPFLIAIRGTSMRRAVLLGIVWGVVAAWSVGDWMPRAVMRYYAQPLLVGVLVFFASALGTAGVQYAGFALLGRRLVGSGRWWTPLAVAAAWTAAELARVVPVTGNPWALLGYAQVDRLWLVQIADVTGVYGPGFVVAAVNAALAELCVAVASRRATPERGAFVGAAVVAVLVATTAAYGAARLHGMTGPRPPGVPVAIVQGNRDLGTQWRPELHGQNLGAYLALTRAALDAGPARLVVWPENALTFFLEDEAGYRGMIAALLAPRGTQLLTGGPRAVADAGAGPAYRNAAYVVTSGGQVAGVYEKAHLVPFAEYFPWQLDFLARDVGAVRTFTAGARHDPLPTVAGRAGVLICNEAMFGSHGRARVRDGAEVLVTLANDGWVGEPRYAEQAFDMARMRAVETRRWLVRASTSGPSGMIDPAGRVTSALPLGREGVVRGAVVPSDARTAYARVGDVFAWACAIVALVAAWRRPARSRGR